MKLKQPHRRLLSLLLLTTSLLSAIPLSAETFTVGGALTYDVWPDAAMLCDCDEHVDGNLIIPESIEYGGRTYPVTRIGGAAFVNCRHLLSVTIPSSVTEIGSGAFGNSSLTKILVASDNPIYCSSLDGILFNYGNELVAFPAGRAGEYQIPNSVTSIGSDAFSGCSRLTSVTIPSSVTTIGKRAFWYCSGLTSVTIPNSVTTIGNATFYGCSSLTSVTIPNSVTSIGVYAFSDCKELTSVTIPNSVMTIGEGAFWGCSSLTSVTIPNSITTISSSAFRDCSGLISVTIPNSVTSIGESAFAYCSGLTSVLIPSSVTSIGKDVFSECTNLESIYLFGGKSTDELPVEAVYTFYDNGYSYDNAVYLVGEITTTQTTAEFDVLKVGSVESFDFEHVDTNGVAVKETVNQSGRVSLGNLPAGSTLTLKVTVHMANGEAYKYNSEIKTKDAEDQSAIEVVEVEEAGRFDVYTLSGSCVRRKATDLRGLRPGIYIANGRKFIVR